MIYWGLILLFALFIWVERYSFVIVDVKKAANGRKVYCTIVAIVFILFSFLRSDAVGKDTQMYHTLFEYAKESSSFNELIHSWKSGGTEIGYLVMEYIISRFAGFQFHLLITAIITIVPTMVLIYKYSDNCFLSLFLFVSFGYYGFFMNGIRQSIAMGICFLAYVCAREKKLYLFLLLIALAVLFHKSAIFFLPVYWLSRIKMNKYIPYVFCGTVGIAFCLKKALFVFLNMYSRQVYSSTSDAGGVRMYLFMLCTIVILWVYRKPFLKDDSDGNNLLLMYMTAIAGIMWPIASANTAVFRLCYYYHVFFILSVPNLISSIKEKWTKIAIVMFFVVVGCYYLQAYVVHSDLNYAPYYFFWSSPA